METVLVEEITESFSAYGGMYSAESQSSFDATVGETYKVYWDGTAYECACSSFHGLPAIGNFHLVGGSSTGEPFFMSFNNGVTIEILTADTTATHTFSISQYSAGEVVKIDEKFMPDVSGLIVKAAAAGSTKKFKITVEDSGAISGTEVS